MLDQQAALRRMNQWGGEGRPFLFVLDFEGRQNLLHPLDELPENIQFQLGGDQAIGANIVPDFHFVAKPVDFTTYELAFQQVMAELKYGNSYLVNLTFPTQIDTSLDLETIYRHSRAPYKLLIDEQFVVFSPEPFVRIREHKIYSYPMKGTIDADLPEAENLILENPKEAAEHATIVDLIRNDLNRVAENVRVERFRYLEKLETFRGSLLQVSSEIVGDLTEHYAAHLGHIIFSLLPAGSISGAPKEKTVEIIKAAEMVNRAFFTGIFGVFDGLNLDSAVMIRFIEQVNGQLVFRSGGGITAQSEARKEYEEMIQKVYVPFV